DAVAVAADVHAVQLGAVLRGALVDVDDHATAVGVGVADVDAVAFLGEHAFAAPAGHVAESIAGVHVLRVLGGGGGRREGEHGEQCGGGHAENLLQVFVLPRWGSRSVTAAAVTPTPGRPPATGTRHASSPATPGPVPPTARGRPPRSGAPRSRATPGGSPVAGTPGSPRPARTTRSAS